MKYLVNPTNISRNYSLQDFLKEDFDYSPRNTTPFLPATKIIIDYMNANFNEFVSAGTKGTYSRNTNHFAKPSNPRNNRLSW